jgi:hypothetical protein
MSTWSRIAFWATTVYLGALVAGSGAMAREITVVSTAGPMPVVMGALIPIFERASGNKVVMKFESVHFAALRNDGVKQWEKNVRTLPALSIVSREASPLRPGLDSMADSRQASEIGKGLGFDAGARSGRRFSSP